MNSRIPFCLLFALTASHSYAGNLLHGTWQCATSFSRPEGQYRVQSETLINADGTFLSQGKLFAYNALIGTEIPLSFSAHGAWTQDAERLTGIVQEGDITTGYALFDRIADMLEAEVQKQPQFTTQIKQLDKQSLILADTTHQPVECIKAAAGENT